MEKILFYLSALIILIVGGLLALCGGIFSISFLFSGEITTLLIISLLFFFLGMFLVRKTVYHTYKKLTSEKQKNSGNIPKESIEVESESNKNNSL